MNKRIKKKHEKLVALHASKWKYAKQARKSAQRVGVETRHYLWGLVSDKDHYSMYLRRRRRCGKNETKITQRILSAKALIFHERARRVTANDIFNYRSSMTKVSGGSELIMPMGAGNEAPISVDQIPAAESPINNELLETMKSEAVNSTPVPALLLTNGGVSEIEFAKETELANTKFESFISSCKIDFNRDATKLYRRILRWETDIDPAVLQNLKFVFRMPTAKQLTVTAEKINNFNALYELTSQTFLSPEELKGNKDEGENNSKVAREFKKLLLAEHMPELDIDRYEELANRARDEANKERLNNAESNKNILDETTPEAGEELI